MNGLAPAGSAIIPAGSRRMARHMTSAAIISNYIILLVLAGCAAIPEQKIVTSVATLPPQKIAVSVLCVKASDIPDMPATTFDPKAAYTEQLAAQAQADIDNLKIYAGQLNAIAVGCAKQEAAK